MYYFDLLPRELNFIILLKINVILLFNKLYQLDIFKSILDSHIFWNMKVNHDFSRIIKELVPYNLYNYNKDNNYYAHSYNFSRLQTAYQLSEKTISIAFRPEKNNSIIEHHLSFINNYDVYTLKYSNTKLTKDELENIYNIIKVDIQTTGALLNTIKPSIRILFGKEKSTFTLINSQGSTFEYKVSKSDIFNLLLHMYCNNFD
jgi:hypothetical protein